MTLDKLSRIRGDLVRNDKEWESWESSAIGELVNATQIR